ncbi:hypothetical protein PHG31p3 [Aeromonas phage 31]|uniref:Uncharacterized protein n=4 Tax=Biquartavirus TaxID=1912143 RepID=Q6U9U9_9CAUD|nr:hypothetical protein ST44RRORF003c [Aeromonas phage 44RR2.8t]YP_238732.1 hypothetical protein PHG31p3 [Aeromonas phage 31]APU00475.1 hypothetical protein [Aeromonas phage 44RR2.8t.2]APU00898.1 hypothetical protein [Aeromonas phage 31.2]APU01804.1 hypothetical protein [Aeromonas phage L9-6]APU02055.1 hypothetical protein [Aeromonas phage Riv-10]APU02304.1 hypothetical protein [Aeromonas phage SW69-9]UYD59563.1 hypothetical protein JNMOADIG_00034 [Aeromonas phage avDM5]UYD60463.1 hypotheti
MTLYEELNNALERVCRINIRFMGDQQHADELTENVSGPLERLRIGQASRRDMGVLCASGIVHEANLFGANIPNVIDEMIEKMKAEVQY